MCSRVCTGVSVFFVVVDDDDDDDELMLNVLRCQLT